MGRIVVSWPIQLVSGPPSSAQKKRSRTQRADVGISTEQACFECGRERERFWILSPTLLRSLDWMWALDSVPFSNPDRTSLEDSVCLENIWYCSTLRNCPGCIWYCIWSLSPWLLDLMWNENSKVDWFSNCEFEFIISEAHRILLTSGHGRMRREIDLNKWGYEYFRFNVYNFTLVCHSTEVLGGYKQENDIYNSSYIVLHRRIETIKTIRGK